MMWKEIANSDELICYEKKKSERVSIRIEARQHEENWGVYKIYHTDAKCLHVDEYEADTRFHAEELIKRLQSEPEMDEKALVDSKFASQGKLDIKMKRAYKEPYVEKWVLKIENMKDSGIIVIREGDFVEMDILLNRKFEDNEKEIIQEINRMFGIRKNFEDFVQYIYYFSKTSRYKSGFKGQQQFLMGNIEFGFDE